MAFVLSAEHLAKQVDSYYSGILDRSADPGGQTNLVNALASGAMTDQTAQAELWGSQEAEQYWS